jgi:hypothetical protein
MDVIYRSNRQIRRVRGGFQNLRLHRDGLKPNLIILILLMLAPVFYGLKVWIQVLGAEEIRVT